MEQRLNSEQQMTQYLLGELSAEEQMELETEYFADSERFIQLQAVEFDLVEGYVSGKLSIADRARFEQHFLSSPARRGNVEFFKILAEAVPLEKNQPLPVQAPMHSVPDAVEPARAAGWWQSLWDLSRGPIFALRLMFAAATIFLVAIGLWLIIETVRLRQQLTQTERERAALQHRERELKHQIDSQRERNSQLSQELADIRQRIEAISVPQLQSAPAMVSFSWTVSGLRSTDPSGKSLRRLVIPPKTSQVQLAFRLPANSHSPYHLTMQAPTGNEIWRRNEIKTSRLKTGVSLALKVPAELFKKGTYSLVLRGNNARGELIEIGDFPIEVNPRSNR